MQAGHLYQLQSNRKYAAGTPVAVNGPHDKYGRILSSEAKDGSYLNLIRGCALKHGEKPKAQF